MKAIASHYKHAWLLRLENEIQTPLIFKKGIKNAKGNMVEKDMPELFCFPLFLSEYFFACLSSLCINDSRKRGRQPGSVYGLYIVLVMCTLFMS